jgi:hypothetical protein
MLQETHCIGCGRRFHADMTGNTQGESSYKLPFVFVAAAGVFRLLQDDSCTLVVQVVCVQVDTALVYVVCYQLPAARMFLPNWRKG